VWALQQDRTRVDAFAWGVAAGSATLLTAGTALCRAEDVQRLRTQVVISAPARLSR
jgi:6-phosphofructokinase 2